MADDITNRQLLSALTEQLGVISDNMVTGRDLGKLEERLERKFERLERKISSSHTANAKHHLQTRDDIGKLNQELTGIREGLARAVRRA